MELQVRQAESKVVHSIYFHKIHRIHLLLVHFPPVVYVLEGQDPTQFVSYANLLPVQAVHIVELVHLSHSIFTFVQT